MPDRPAGQKGRRADGCRPCSRPLAPLAARPLSRPTGILPKPVPKPKPKPVPKLMPMPMPMSEPIPKPMSMPEPMPIFMPAPAPGRRAARATPSQAAPSQATTPQATPPRATLSQPAPPQPAAAPPGLPAVCAQPRRRPWRRGLAAALCGPAGRRLALAALVALSAPAPAAAADEAADAVPASAVAIPTFYDPPPLPEGARPGTVLRAERAPEADTGGAGAVRLLYVTTDYRGRPTVSSAMAWLPQDDTAGPRPVVAWAHPTTGIARACAPSLAAAPVRRVPGLAELLATGAIVVATDYPGLGTPGPTAYLIGRAEGQAVLDSVRAMHRLKGVSAAPRFAIYGHSQGGQASLFAGTMAAGYAPELTLAGVAAAAPAADLTALTEASNDTAIGRWVLAMALDSWRQFYPRSRPVLDPVTAAFPADFRAVIVDSCLMTAAEFARIQLFAKPLNPALADRSALRRPPLPALLARNSARPLPPEVPLLVLQGGDDTVVPAKVTRAFVEASCQAGGRVQVFFDPTQNHFYIALANGSRMAGWLSDRLAGKPARNDCGRPWETKIE